MRKFFNWFRQTSSLIQQAWQKEAVTARRRGRRPFADARGAHRDLPTQGTQLVRTHIAVDTATARPEEFPHFTRFWLERPKGGGDTITVYAALDGPRPGGARTRSSLDIA